MNGRCRNPNSLRPLRPPVNFFYFSCHYGASPAAKTHGSAGASPSHKYRSAHVLSPPAKWGQSPAPSGSPGIIGIGRRDCKPFWGKFFENSWRGRRRAEWRNNGPDPGMAEGSGPDVARVQARREPRPPSRWPKNGPGCDYTSPASRHSRKIHATIVDPSRWWI